MKLSKFYLRMCNKIGILWTDEMIAKEAAWHRWVTR